MGEVQAGAAGAAEVSSVDLRVRLGRLALRNPILSASGTFGYAVELERFYDPGVLGAIVGKSITLEPRAGNPPPRMAETPSGMLNAIGLQNPGIDRFLAELLPAMLRYKAPVVVSVAGRTEQDYVRLAQRLSAVEGVAALELNLSCPNVAHGGIRFSTDPRAAEGVCLAVRRVTELPVLAKLTPNVTDVGEIARACEAGGADAITAINTVLGMRVDWRRRRPVLANRVGGLSGPAIFPIAVRVIDAVRRAVSLPIVGAGGVRTADDVLEMVAAGATAVQVGTQTFVDPYAIPKILAELPCLLATAGISRLCDLVGVI